MSFVNSCFRVQGSVPAIIAGVLAGFLWTILLFPSQAGAKVLCKDDPKLQGQLPVYKWQDPTLQPKAIAIAIHGLTLHGGVYDKLATHLAEKGYLVFAPDLRGYGRSQEQSVSYGRSFHDLTLLLATVKNNNPGLPIYLIGESLGADMALHLASDQSKLVNGLVLSSPAIKRRYFLGPIASEAIGFLSNPLKEFDLKPYMGRYFSEDPRITEETLNDPLVRKHLTAWDLLRTCMAIRPSLKYADRLAPNIPVLIIQGADDRMVRTNAVVLLEKHLKSTDQTVHWFNDRGHLLLETAYLSPDCVNAVDGWLDKHLAHKLIAVHETNLLIQLKPVNQLKEPTDSPVQLSQPKDQVEPQTTVTLP